MLDLTVTSSSAMHPNPRLSLQDLHLDDGLGQPLAPLQAGMRDPRDDGHISINSTDSGGSDDSSSISAAEVVHAIKDIVDLTLSDSDDDDHAVEVMNAEEAAAFQIRVRQQKRKKVRHRASKPRRTVNVLTVDAEQVAPNQPLPKPPTLTLPRELATFNHPLDAHERRMWHEESYAKKYEASASKRAQGRVEQRKLDGTKWTTHWALESVMQGCSGRQIMRFLSPVLAPARSLTFASLTQDQAAFFPYPECEGLGALDGVFATVGGDMIELWRLRDHNSTQSGAFTASRNGQRILSNKLACAQLSALGAAQKNDELLTFAWSVKTTTFPFTPLLAVAGKLGLIHVFIVELAELKGQLRVALTYDRTICSHTRAVSDLKFSPSHPHLLVSASGDNTVRLSDPTVPNGYRCTDPSDGKIPIPPAGQNIGILARKGHIKGVLSVDIHPRFPLVVTSGLDGKVLIWHIPAELRGPTWPTTELFRHPPILKRTTPPILAAPIFTSTSVHVKWCDQVLWACAHSAHLISKASRAPTDSHPMLGKEVFVWIPAILDPRPPSSFYPHSSASTAAATAISNDDLASATDRLLGELPLSLALPTQANRRPISSPFRIIRKIDLDDDDALGERMGLHLVPSLESDVHEDIEAILSTTIFLHTANEPALYAFRPFGPLPPPTPATTHAASYLAKGKDRERYEFSPRLQPSAITDMEMGELGEAVRTRGEARVRCLAVVPNGAKWVVGVGDGGLMMVWRRRRGV